MKALCWYGKNDVRVETVPDPKILNPRDAIVKITTTAICGSDLHLYDGYIPTMQAGDILGHEFMGEVVEIGSDVKNLKPGDRVVVPFTIACGNCFFCERDLWSLCDNSNPNAWMAEELYGASPSGLFGYSHMLGGYAGGQAEYARVPFADVGPIKIPDGMADEQALFLSDSVPTGWTGADFCDIQEGDTIAVWGAGPVGQFAAASARLLGAERVVVIDRLGDRLQTALDGAGATDVLDYEDTDIRSELLEMTGGRGPDACIDCVGLEAHHHHGGMYAYDRVKQATRLQTERGYALREAIFNCRNGGTVSIMGVYGGFMDKFPIGAVMNRGLTIKTGQCHVHRYLRPLLEHIEKGDIDPSFIVTHRMSLDDAPTGYETFKHKQDECVKVVMTP